MKITYIILGLFVIGGLFICAKNKSTAFGFFQQFSQVKKQNIKSKENENKYNELRNLAFTVTPENLNLTFPSDMTVVYGTIMDWDYKGVTVTVVSFITGDASLYLSSGQIFIGGFAHEKVKKSATNFVSSSQTYLSKATKTFSTIVADKECIRFYFLTNNGIFTYQETVANITQPTNEWSNLNNLAQNVIKEYRLIVK